MQTVRVIFRNQIFLLIILVALSLLAHFLFFGYPAEVVFDEVHYGKFVNGYLTGEYFYDVHPPLGAQLLALGGWFGGYSTGDFSFEKIGQQFSDTPYFGLRALPSLVGSFIPLVIYFFLRQIGVARLTAFFAGLFLVFENALLVHSRFALPDVFLILFGFLGLTFFFAARKRNYNYVYLFAASIFLAFSISVKWTGGAFIAFAGIVYLFDALLAVLTSRQRKIILFVKALLFFLFIPGIIYFSLFSLHFALLPNSGLGDVYMSEEFLKGEKNGFEKFVELNLQKFESNIQLAASHPYASSWYTWPLQLRSVYYWAGDSSYIYLLGNPVLWWASTIAVVIFLPLLFILKLWCDTPALVLFFGYVISFLPFAFIGRIMFLYHYLTPMIFAVMLLVYLLSKSKYATRLTLGLFALVVISFLYFVPLTYGLSLSEDQLQNRLWLDGWR